MAAKILAHDDLGHSWRFRVHLDTERCVEGGAPDPAYVREWTFGLQAGETGEGIGAKAQMRPVTSQEQRVMIERELRALVQHELAKLALPKKGPLHGLAL